jgi:predicted Ser/Thr protein kinase
VTPPRPASRHHVLNDRFRLVYQLGTGGQGSVWLAEDTRLERPVALKELAQPRGGSADLDERRMRVLQEARALARVRHPAIVPIHDLFFIGDDPWIVMEYIGGRGLDQIIRAGTLDERSIAGIGLHVLRGLAAVHRAGIVHRDVKPANILVADDGSVFLVDFGIARIAGDPSLTGHSVIGTVEYLAPERLKPGARVGPPADVWALGVTFFQALEGYSPFDRHSEQDPAAVMLAITQETPKLTRHGTLADITLRMLVKDPAQRASAEEVRHALAGIAGEAPQPLPRASGRPTAPLPGVMRERASAADVPAGPATRPLNKQTAGRNGVRDEILRVGPDTGAAMLLTLDVRSSARILADCPARHRGELLQGIAAVEPATAATILRMLLDTTAGLAFGYLQPQTAASLLSAMPGPEAVRILVSTDARAAGSAIMELAPAHAAALLKSMSDARRAAEVLTHATSQTAIAVVRADRSFGRVIQPYLTEPLRTQVSRTLAETT